MKKRFSIAVAVILAGIFISCDNSGGSHGDPVLSGSVNIPVFIRVGDVVVSNTGNLNGNGTISYLWEHGNERNGPFAPIAGAANAANYMAVSSNLDRFIRVTVTREGYRGSISSNAVLVRPEGAMPPSVTGVEITDNWSWISVKSKIYEVDVARGDNFYFLAIVSGSNLEDSDRDVIWSVSGQTKNDTVIGSNGVLLVAPDETAQTLTVRAESVVNPARFDTVTVNVTEPEGKIIIITGIPEEFEGYEVFMYIYDVNGSSVAGGSSFVFNRNLTFTLYDYYNYEAWNGSGQHSIDLQFESYKAFVFTNGAPLPEDENNLPKYNFQNAVSTIPFNLFRERSFESSGAGPGNGGSGNGGYDPVGHQIEIYGLGDYIGRWATVYVFYQNGYYLFNDIAVSSLYIDEEYKIFTLQSTYDGRPWEENGSYYLRIEIDNNWQNPFLYTAGQTFIDLGIGNSDDLHLLPMITFDEYSWYSFNFSDWRTWSF